MKKAAEYQQHAEECRTLANKASRAEDRETLIQMAETWESLAKERARQVAQQRRIEELERLSLPMN
jgi:hypothetical protein